MTIIRCDSCGAIIESQSDSIAISRGLMFRGVELCAACGAPAAELLDRVAAKRRSEGRERQIEA